MEEHNMESTFDHGSTPIFANQKTTFFLIRAYPRESVAEESLPPEAISSPLS
jgi:hypothetical protein